MTRPGLIHSILGIACCATVGLCALPQTQTSPASSTGAEQVFRAQSDLVVLHVNVLDRKSVV